MPGGVGKPARKVCTDEEAGMTMPDQIDGTVPSGQGLWHQLTSLRVRSLALTLSKLQFKLTSTPECALDQTRSFLLPQELLCPTLDPVSACKVSVKGSGLDIDKFVSRVRLRS